MSQMPPGHVTHNHQGQHVDGHYGQEECKLYIGDAIEDVVHLQFFLELGLGSAMATTLDVGVVCIQNPSDHICVSHSCFLLAGNVRSYSWLALPRRHVRTKTRIFWQTSLYYKKAKHWQIDHRRTGLLYSWERRSHRNIPQIRVFFEKFEIILSKIKKKSHKYELFGWIIAYLEL